MLEVEKLVGGYELGKGLAEIDGGRGKRMTDG